MPVSPTAKFRFHTGSIKRPDGTEVFPFRDRSFDSILVRLKELIIRENNISTKIQFRFHTGSIKSQGLMPIY